VYFGSLEHSINDGGARLDNAILSGNVNISTVESETLELAQASVEEQERHAETLRELEVKRRERSLTVPTDDGEVKLQLRALGHPICLFGEREADRRNRLRTLLARIEVDSDEHAKIKELLGNLENSSKRMRRDSTSVVGKKLRKDTFYTVAGKSLVKARRAIADFSWKHTTTRLKQQRQTQQDPDKLLEQEERILDLEDQFKTMTVYASQVGDRRPLSCCEFGGGGDQNIIGTGSFSGVGAIWERESCSKVCALHGHEDRIVDLCFRDDRAGENTLMVTASADETAKLWKVPSSKEEFETLKANSVKSMECEEQGGGEDPASEQANNEKDPEVPRVDPIGTFKGHAQRLSQISWHPIGNYVGTSSYDHTWRLWDVETTTEILLQEGHSYPVYAFAFHGDGSLALSGDLRGVTRLWDLRSGKSIDTLRGHVTQTLCADFSIDGYHVATGSGDHTARVWDLRQRRCLHVIPGHASLVSQTRFDKVTGCTLATSSFDGTCKLWTTSNLKLLSTLEAHDNKIMDMAISKTADTIMTCSYDRTWKFWGVSAYA